MRMTVNQVCNGFIAGHFLDRLRNFPCIGLRRVHHDDTAIVNKKHRLDLVVRNHVETASEVLETVPLGWVDGRALSGSRHIEVFGGPYAYRRNRRQVRRRWKTCIVEFNAAPEGNRIPSPKAVELPDFACVTSHRSSVYGASPVPLCARSRISASGVASRTFTGLVFLSHELSSTHLHFIRECLTGRSSCFAARQPNAKAHGVKQSKSLVVTQYAEPLLPTSAENQNR